MEKHVGQKLINKLLEGDEQAFHGFFNEYFPRLFQFAYSRLWRDESLAEEAAQRALSKIVQKLETYRGEAELFTWMCTFCRHEVGAIIKREKKLNNKVLLIQDSDEVTAGLASMAQTINEDPLVKCQQQELALMVQAAKVNISSIYSDILELKYIYCYSVNEIAEKIERSPKATESLLTRARIAFREAFSMISNSKKITYISNKR